MVGSCSTRPGATTGPPVAVEAGVDEWRVAFGTSIVSGPCGGFDLGPCWRGQWFPGVGVLTVEGHPAGPGALAPPAGLPAAYQDVLDQLAEWGHVPTRLLGISRLDSTVTLRFSEARQGTLLLAGLAGLDWPAAEAIARPAVWPRSVAVVHPKGRSRQLRGYDKGQERGDVAAGTAEPGELIRLEAQWRFKGDRRPSVAELSPDAVRSRFESRFLPLYRSTKGVKIATLPTITAELADRAAAGDLTHRQVERLTGYLVLQDRRATCCYPGRTAKRRRAELREQGLVAAPGFSEPVEVELASVLEAALDSEHWGARG